MSRLLLMITLFASCAASHGTVATPSPTDSVAALAGRRAELIGWLHDYRVAGVYPVDARGNPASVFVDGSGVRCPMAELVHKSGRDDLVDAVQREGNAVRLADVHTGPLHDWMLASGLTQEEIAMVQGAMNIEPYFGEAPISSIARAEVRGQLEMAEAALRQATAASLAIAANRLPTPNVAALAASPIKGHVLAARFAGR